MSSGAPANRPTENMEGEDDDVGFMYEGLVRCLTSKEVEEDRRRDVLRREHGISRRALKDQEPRSEMEQPVVEHPVMEHQAQHVQDIVAEEQEDDDEYIDVGSPPPMPEDYIPIHLALLEKDRLRKEEATVSFLNENPDYLQKNMELGAEGQPISAVESPGVNPASIGETSVIFPIAPTYSLPMWNYFSALSTGYVAFPTVGISSVFITSETSAFYNPGQVLGTDPLVADTVPDQEAPVDLSRQTGQNDPRNNPGNNRDSAKNSAQCQRNFAETGRESMNQEGTANVLADVEEDVDQDDLQRLRLTSWLLDGYEGEEQETDENGILPEAQSSDAVDDENEEAAEVVLTLQKASMDLEDVKRDASVGAPKEIGEDAPEEVSDEGLEREFDHAAEDSSNKGPKMTFENVGVKSSDNGVVKILDDVRRESSKEPPKEVIEDAPETTECQDSATSEATNPIASTLPTTSAASNIEEPPQPEPEPREQLQGILEVRSGDIEVNRTRPKKCVRFGSPSEHISIFLPIE